MKAVKVLWLDSCSSNTNWTIAEDIEIEPMYIESFGVVIKDTDEFLAIAQNYGDNPEQYSNIMTIPKGCIKEVFVIHEDKCIVWLEKQKEPELEEDFGDFVERLHSQFPEVSFAKLSRIAVRVKNWVEGNSANEVNGEGIDGLYHAIRILERTLGEVEGYQTDDGILEHKAAITAVKKLYERPKPIYMVGDWVILNGNHNSIYQVTKIENYHYVIEHILGGVLTIPFGSENSIRLWTIEDAKDGDVLVVDNNVFIYAHRKQMYPIAVAHCFIDSTGDLFGYVGNGNSTYPATRKQRDTLFAKMKEAGYYWDAEKKQVIKL